MIGIVIYYSTKYFICGSVLNLFFVVSSSSSNCDNNILVICVEHTPCPNDVIACLLQTSRVRPEFPEAEPAAEAWVRSRRTTTLTFSMTSSGTPPRRHPTVPVKTTRLLLILLPFPLKPLSQRRGLQHWYNLKEPARNIRCFCR